MQIQSQPPQCAQEGQPEDELTLIDTQEMMERIDGDGNGTDKKQKSIQEESYHVEHKEESSTKSSTSSTGIQ